MPQGLTDLSLALAMRLRDMARMLDRGDESAVSGLQERIERIPLAVNIRSIRSSNPLTVFSVMAAMKEATASNLHVGVS